MKERERVVVTGVLSVLLLGWLGFLVHRAPRFAGSGAGSAIGIAAAILMLLPLVYPVAKRIPFVQKRLARHVSMQSLLTGHIYAGIFGPLLAVVHTGHKYDSWLGVALTAAMLLVVVSGFVVRYLLTYVRREIADKLLLLETARGDLDSAWGVLETSPSARRGLPSAPFFAAALASVGLQLPYGGAVGEVTRIAESVADLEYAVRTHELFKRWFSRGIKLHIILSVIFYALLSMHIGSGIYYGLRWMR